MALIVTGRGDLRWFVLGLQHILLDPAISPRSYVNNRYAYSDDDAREIMAYVLRELAPDAALGATGSASRVLLAEMPRRQWAGVRDSQVL